MTGDFNFETDERFNRKRNDISHLETVIHFAFLNPIYKKIGHFNSSKNPSTIDYGPSTKKQRTQ